MQKKYLTPRDVESIYSIPRRSLANMRWAGRGPQYYKAGKKVLYRPEDIERWIGATQNTGEV